MHVVTGMTETDALRFAASVEHDAEHPVARAIVWSATDAKLTVSVATNFTSIPGQGVSATVDGRALTVGGPNLLTQLKVSPAPELSAFEDDAAARGQGVIFLVDGAQARAAFAVADAVRPESAEAVAALRVRPCECVRL